MGEFFIGIAAGVVVSLLNKFVINGTFWKTCEKTHCNHDDDEEDMSSQNSAIVHDIHIH